MLFEDPNSDDPQGVTARDASAQRCARSADPTVWRYRYEAMATEFTIFIAGIDQTYARQAADEACRELHRIEKLLSRFIPCSDVSLIGRANAGQIQLIDPDTCDCLQTALRLENATRSAFCIAFRHVPPGPTTALLSIATTPPTVRPSADKVQLDLGGIGKGFALDRMAFLLREWGIRRFLLAASTSTLLAGDAPECSCGWKIQWGGALGPYLYLRRAAFSGSGRAVKGDHIVDPRTGHAVDGRAMAWAGAITAAEADALSTAFMVMPFEAIRELTSRDPQRRAYVQVAYDEPVQSLHATSSLIYRTN